MGPEMETGQIETTLREYVRSRYAGGGSGHALEPEDDLQLEGQRSLGATHVVVPDTSLWWLDEYAGLRDYLEARSGAAGRSEAGVVYALAAA